MQYINYNLQSSAAPAVVASNAMMNSERSFGPKHGENTPSSTAMANANGNTMLDWQHGNGRFASAMSSNNFHRPHYSLDGQTMVAFELEPRPLRDGAYQQQPTTMMTANTVSSSSSPSLLSSIHPQGSTASVATVSQNGFSSEWDQDDIESIADVNPEECVISSEDHDALKQDGWFDGLSEDPVVASRPAAAVAPVSKVSSRDAALSSDAAIATATEEACPSGKYPV